MNVAEHFACNFFYEIAQTLAIKFFNLNILPLFDNDFAWNNSKMRKNNSYYPIINGSVQLSLF